MAAVRTWLGRPAGSRRRRLALLAALASTLHEKKEYRPPGESKTEAHEAFAAFGE